MDEQHHQLMSAYERLLQWVRAGDAQAAWSELHELEEMGGELEEAEEPEEAEMVEVREEPLEELEPPAEEPAVEEPPAEDPRLERLRKAYEEGKISKEVYEENLRKITGE